MNQIWSGNECGRTHTLTTTTTGHKTDKKKPTIRQATRAVFCAPKGPFLTESWSWLKSSARHTLSNRGLSEIHLRLVNLAENAV